MSKKCPNCGTPYAFDEFGMIEECCSPSTWEQEKYDD